MKKSHSLLIWLVSLGAVVAFILSMSFLGAEGFDWFAGFKLDSPKAINSVALGTWTLVTVGISLSIAGSTMQSLTRNNLASAFSLGTTTSAMLALVIVNFLLPQLITFLHVSLIYLLTTLISMSILWLTFSRRIAPAKIIVVSLTFSILISSLNYIIRSLLGLPINDLIGFLSLAQLSATWLLFWVAMPISALSVFGILFLSKRIHIYSIDPSKSSTLAISAKRLKIISSFLVILIATSAVLLIGPISFVGIIVPHITKFLIRGSSLTKQMMINIPVSIVILLVANLIWSATFSLGTNINFILALLAGPIMIYSILRSR